MRFTSTLTGRQRTNGREIEVTHSTIGYLGTIFRTDDGYTATVHRSARRLDGVWSRRTDAVLSLSDAREFGGVR